MKKFTPTFSTAIIALVALTFLMGYTKPMPPEPTQYIIVMGNFTTKEYGITTQVNQKLAEGWHLEGGISNINGSLTQAMSK